MLDGGQLGGCGGLRTSPVPEHSRAQVAGLLEANKPLPSIGGAPGEALGLWETFGALVDIAQKAQYLQPYGLSTIEDIYGLLQIDELRPALLEVFNKLSWVDQLNIVERHPHADLRPLAMKIYLESGSYRWAETAGEKVLLGLADHWTADDIGAILEGIEKNGQIYAAAGTSDVLVQWVKHLKGRFGSSFGGLADWPAFAEGLSEHYDNYAELSAELAI